MRSESPPAWQPPAAFGEYRLVQPLGRGAMGEVYLAHDTVLDRLVAVKFIAGIAPDEMQRERFRTEARAIARVQHPNVVGIHRVGEVQERPYLVSEFLRGESLDRLSRPAPWTRVLEIGIGLARGLAAAHRQGVLHRDLKPANALLTEDGQVKLLDFGVAKLLDVATAPVVLVRPPEGLRPVPVEGAATVDVPIPVAPATADVPRAPASMDAAQRTATVPPLPPEWLVGPSDLLATGRIGTPLYMAPEVWRGEPATVRSDLFSLGVLLYELCGGSTPGPLVEAPARPRIFEPLDVAVPGVDATFAAVLARCLAHDPVARFDSADALREALESIASRSAPPAIAPPRPRWLRVTRVLALPGIAVAVLVGGNWWGERSRRIDAEEAMASAAARFDEGRALGDRIEALRAEAFIAFDTDGSAKAEPIWAQALDLGAKQARHYQDASELLEASQKRVGRGTNPALDQRVAEVLFQRILVAERDRDPKAKKALTEHLEELDPSATTSRKVTAPAHLELDSEPAGADIQVETFDPQPGGPPRWSEPRAFGKTPMTSGLTLEPGSYRLTFMLPGRQAVRYPVLLARGETFQAKVPIPEHVPDGFVYVPSGRFLYGSGDDESIRRSRPVHGLTTGAFFIARHEVTYADWISWLRELPAHEREARRPRGTNYYGTIELLPAKGGTWTFHLEHEGIEYQAREGELLRYQDRTLRAEQDWRRFPVSGISWEDARAYTAWLDTTGRVPRARLCTEREWERAARGADGRAYPHGPTLAPDDANFDATYGRKPGAFGPDAVGSHPVSDSPFGISDMSGNVWEWLVTDPTGAPAYGGGSFYQDARTALTLNHGDGEPRTRFPFIGMRVCASAP
ncbi:bifunctional serine/threonine-protein kinase/formylglycine-generating enzyme family protein [Corallococcus sp. EGB]|uniref:bifunctional serine/threonine-protein kinase/formylglycine-generating enzyme family protein n=1 Tax=Corallococcus sp. EGB TaxID=1521117 RepID=UPI001CBB149A|nr:bifunctional serine/threonine-protein kinase/formylglycine-generating enzyme family protein [Corallococcus sp. EGB]